MNATRSELLQAIRGPVMLITLGVLMVLDYFGGISFTAHTWPFLLIVFGALKLAEKSARQQNYTRPMAPPMPPQPDPLADPFFPAQPPYSSQPPYPPPPPRYTGGRPQ